MRNSEKKTFPFTQAWCLTFHEEYDFEVSCSNPDDVKYFICGKEICPTTNKSHGQAYMELVRPMRMAGVKTLLGSDTVHCEPRRGTRDQARDYCMKEDPTPYEFGTWEVSQGSRYVTKWVA